MGATLGATETRAGSQPVSEGVLQFPVEGKPINEALEAGKVHGTSPGPARVDQEVLVLADDLAAPLGSVPARDAVRRIRGDVDAMRRLRLQEHGLGELDAGPGAGLQQGHRSL